MSALRALALSSQLVLPLSGCHALLIQRTLDHGGSWEDSSTGTGGALMTVSADYARGVGGDEGDDDGPGYAAELNMAAAGESPIGTYARLVGGSYGGDAMGIVDAGVGPMVGGGVYLGLTAGLSYGGFARSALTVPARVVLGLRPAPFGALATVYGGYRFGGSEPKPDGASAWGAGIDALYGGALSASAGLGWDRQDGIDVITFRLGFGLAASKQ